MPCGVLVVDDDRDIRTAYRDVLEAEGYTVHEAENGREGVDALQAGLRPCVILLDLMMPIMNGWQALDVIRGNFELAQIPVAVVSAANQEAPEGATRMVRKPMSLDALLGVVGEFC
jgi:CheY-like chemotaxis protein